VTGGAGYIGSVVCQLLLKEKYEVIVLDDLSNGHKSALPEEVKFYNCSTLNKQELEKVFQENPGIRGVMHFAAFIEVGESVKEPAKYFYNNVLGSLNVIDVAKSHGVKGFIFSSTAAVYGIPFKIPIVESTPTMPINPYGMSKLQTEQILKYYHQAYNFKFAALRYFNACGAYNGLGEDHSPETHLIPNVIKVALKKERVLNIFGNDYDTPDGTAIRDYIHVEDLAIAHILALEAIFEDQISNEIFNIGSGTGYSVQEIATTLEKVASEEIPSTMTARREGDPPVLIADTEKIQKMLNWHPKHDLKSIIESAWAWHKNHPEGYKD
jgi:UDP-glucose 4-epimerase